MVEGGERPSHARAGVGRGTKGGGNGQGKLAIWPPSSETSAAWQHFSIPAVK